MSKPVKSPNFFSGKLGIYGGLHSPYSGKFHAGESVPPTPPAEFSLNFSINTNSLYVPLVF